MTEKNELINLGDDNEVSLPMRQIDKSYASEIKDFNETDRSFTAVASTSAVDRDGDILEARGWKLKNYKKNPVVLWSHNSSMPSIAISKDTWVEDDKLLYTPKFMPAEINPFAEQVFQMFKGGFLRASSVRFDPIKWVERKPEDEKGGGDIRRFGFRYTSMDLLEISPVNIPANAEALKSPQMLSFVVKGWLTEHANMIPDIAEREKIMRYKSTLFTPAMADAAGKEVAENSSKIKEKIEKLKALTDEKNLLVSQAEQAKIEAEIDSEIKQLEDYLQEQKILSVIEGALKNIQNGITVLK